MQLNERSSLKQNTLQTGAVQVRVEAEALWTVRGGGALAMAQSIQRGSCSVLMENLKTAVGTEACFVLVFKDTLGGLTQHLLL
jgi:hypothetical protein